MKKTIHTAHDRFFRAALSDSRVAKEFFDSHLPTPIKNSIDLDTLALRKDTFVDDSLELTESDMLFDVTFSGRSGYLYLLVEHQSKPDPLMPFRLLKYMVSIMDQHVKTTQGTELPLIYPLIFYTGERNYTHSTDLFDLFGKNKELARDIFLKPFDLIELNKIPDDDLKQRVWSGIMELSMKNIFKRDILPYLQDMISLLNQAELAGGADYVRTALTYLINTGEIKDTELFLETLETGLSPKMKEGIMTIAEQLEARGEARGIEQGRLLAIEEARSEVEVETKKTIARGLLQEGMSIAAVSRLTGLSIKEVEALNGATNNH